MPHSDDDDTPADVAPVYLAIFSEHVLEFRDHLTGKYGDEQPPASLYAPRAFWSAAEKDVFFHALAVHSRLRPDLIAEEVKTKTVADVCVYLALLDQGDREDSAAGVHVGEHARLHRKDHPSAVEVTDKWLAFEERMAGAVMALQSSLEQEAINEERDEEVHVRKYATRAPRGSGRTASQTRDREGEKARREEFEQWLVRRQKEWEGDDLLLSLDKADLTTLDRMLRDDEEGRGTIAEGNAHISDDEQEHPSEMMQVDEAAEQDPIRPLAQPGDEHIDPALLALSRVDSAFSTAQSAAPDADASTSVQGMTPVTLPLPPVADAYPPQTPPSMATPLSSAIDPALVPLPSSSGAPSVTDDGLTMDGEDLSRMSPASRRRYKKRLYMRRKRAQATGTAIVELAERLKPGRRPKQHPSAAQASNSGSGSAPDQTTVPASSVPGGGTLEQAAVAVAEASGDHGTQRHPHASGPTLPYKRQAQLVSKGIDVQRLRKEGLDLFHLQAVSKLMGTYNQLHDIPKSVGSAVSAETLKLLRAMVVKFVSEVMSRAIVSREQERIAKLQTKAWRLRENQIITTVNVKHALALYGADYLDKSAHFKGLLRKLDLDDSPEEAEAEDAEDEDEPEEAQSPVEPQPIADDAHDVEGQQAAESEHSNQSLPLEHLSLLRTIFPPFMNHLASGLHAGDTLDALDPSVYLPRPSLSSLSTTLELLHDEDVLPEEDDDVAYARELDEDTALDRVDGHRDAEVEKALWARIAGPAGKEDHPITDDKPAPARIVQRAPRKRKRQSVDTDGFRERGMDGGSASERAVEAGLFGEDADGVEQVVPRGRRKKKAKAKGSMSDKQLLYQEPDPNGRIKSAVYILDSD